MFSEEREFRVSRLRRDGLIKDCMLEFRYSDAISGDFIVWSAVLLFATKPTCYAPSSIMSVSQCDFAR